MICQAFIVRYYVIDYDFIGNDGTSCKVLGDLCLLDNPSNNRVFYPRKENLRAF